jgi:Uma2 family endonuclease
MNSGFQIRFGIMRSQLIQQFPMPVTSSQDVKIHLQDKTWDDFEQLDRIFSGVQVKKSFFRGEIVIQMPGQDHEIFSRIIFFLLSTYCVNRQIQFIPTGSFTQKNPPEAAAEADESYCFNTRKSIPDLSIEIVFSSGNESKLAIYQALKVPEVWFWEDGVLRLYRLTNAGYRITDRSEIPELQNLDIAAFSRSVLIAETDMLRAVEEINRLN